MKIRTLNWRSLSSSIVALAICLLSAAAARAEFPLKDGDIWVLAGDSITAQHLHSNYFEAFCYARYPNLKFAFRNSGVGGHTIPSTLARFDYDVAAWNPTVVSVELGMNDQGGTPPDKFIANMVTMVERIRAIHARPVIFTASPVNNGQSIAASGGHNRLNDYANGLKEFAAKENLPFADQFHELVDVWAANKPHEKLADSLSTLRTLATDDSLLGVEHLRAFVAAQDKAPSHPVSMQGDAVHPGPPGQIMMAAALLKELGADGFVSSATIDGATGAVAEAKGCKVDAAKGDGSRVEFDRLDERLPFPIPDEARQVLPLFPAILELSQYTLKVTGLKAGNYTMKINGVPAATLSEKDLGAGVNLTAYGPTPQVKEVGPLIAQSRAILSAVASKEGAVDQFRNRSKKAIEPGAPAELKEQLAATLKQVEAADEKIRAAAKPQKLHFEIAPAQ